MHRNAQRTESGTSVVSQKLGISEAHGSVRDNTHADKRGEHLKTGNSPLDLQQPRLDTMKTGQRKTHRSACAKTIVNNGGGALKAGRPPSWLEQELEKMNASEWHGSVYAAPCPGWGCQLQMEKTTGREPPDKPNESWASWRKQLEAELEVANQGMTWKPGLLHRESDVTCRASSAHERRTNPLPCAQECVGQAVVSLLLADAESRTLGNCERALSACDSATVVPGLGEALAQAWGLLHHRYAVYLAGGANGYAEYVARGAEGCAGYLERGAWCSAQVCPKEGNHRSMLVLADRGLLVRRNVPLGDTMEMNGGGTYLRQ